MVNDVETQIDVSIVVPCYRSEQCLAELVERTMATLDATGFSYEILLVNDASPDNTWATISELCEKHTCVRGIDLLFNTGQYRATFCGLVRSHGNIVVTIDDDLQHPPESIQDVLTFMNDNSDTDCLIGAYEGKKHGLMRNLGTAIMERLFQWLYKKPPGLRVTSYRAMRRTLVDAISSYGTANPNINPLIFHCTHRIQNLGVPHHPRTHGRSGYGFFRLVRLMMDNVLSVSTLPLKCVSAIGFVSALSSLILGIVYLLKAIFGQFNVPGFATTVLLVIFFGGLILFSIGLLGEYMIRIMEEVRGRPRYYIRNEK